MSVDLILNGFEPSVWFSFASFEVTPLRVLDLQSSSHEHRESHALTIDRHSKCDKPTCVCGGISLSKMFVRGLYLILDGLHPNNI